VSNISSAINVATQFEDEEETARTTKGYDEIEDDASAGDVDGVDAMVFATVFTREAAVAFVAAR